MPSGLLRRLYGRILASAPLFEEFARTARLAEEEAVLTLSAARVQAEVERDSYATMLKSIIQNSPTAIYVKDLSGHYLMANEPFERIFGSTEADLLGLTDDLTSVEMAPESRANDILAQRGSYELEEWIDGPDGPHVYESVKFPLYDAEGCLYATGGISLDVTEERRAAAVVAARDAAIAATAAKSTFLATMSHEMRTPMNAVIGMTDMLRETDLDDQQSEFVETVHSSGNALLAVINDILDFSKIESGELQLECGVFALRDGIENCLDLVAAAATVKGLDLVCQFDASCPDRVVGDVGRLRQILANLLSNAVKFTDQGEVLVSVCTTPMEEDRLLLRVDVTDSGLGISEKGVQRLFKSFSQVDPSTTRVYGGTGLGLAISQRLAEAMGGGVEVSSTPELGSTFSVKVVLDIWPDADPGDACVKADGVELIGKSVLVVDDNATSLRVLELQVTALGMTCTAVGSPERALALVADGLLFDVGILDLHMPGLTGVELGHKLQFTEAARDAPLVLLTSLGWRPNAGDHLFAAHLTKPVKQVGLRDSLYSALGRLPATSEPGPDRRGPPDVDRRALRILLAEDNVVNQRVAELMLGKLGHRVQTVANGREAVGAVQNGTFDVVLMDVQMPVMDGLEAARSIRSGLPRQRQPCIVAMTASVLLGDREAAKAAGMERYLSKPVRVKEMRDLLADITSGPGIGSGAVDVDGCVEAAFLGPVISTMGEDMSDQPADGIPPAVNQAIFEELLEQLGDSNGEFRHELIGSYLKEGADQSRDAVAAASSRDAAVFGRSAHALRSTSALIGATTLADMLLQAEAVAREAPEGLSEVAEPISVEYARVAASLAVLDTRPEGSESVS